MFGNFGKKGSARIEAVMDVFKTQIEELRTGAEEIQSEITGNASELNAARVEFEAKEKRITESNVYLDESKASATAFLNNLEKLLGTT